MRRLGNTLDVAPAQAGADTAESLNRYRWSTTFVRTPPWGYGPRPSPGRRGDGAGPFSRGRAAARRTSLTSRKLRLHGPQPGQLHDHLVARLEPHRLHQASRQHQLALVQALAFGGQMIGEPGECVVGVAEHVGAGAGADLGSVDQGTAGDLAH